MAGGAETPKYRSVARHRSLPSTPTGHGDILRHSSLEFGWFPWFRMA